MVVLSATVRCYRKVPGDANCHDVPAFGESLDDMLLLGGQMLLAYTNNAETVSGVTAKPGGPGRREGSGGRPHPGRRPRPDRVHPGLTIAVNGHQC